MAEAAASCSDSKADANVAGFDLSRFQLVSQGAEAVRPTPGQCCATVVSFTDSVCPKPYCCMQRVWEGRYLDVPAIIKQRFSKKYRHAILDKKITQSRLKQVTCPHNAQHHAQTCYQLRLHERQVRQANDAFDLPAQLS